MRSVVLKSSTFDKRGSSSVPREIAEAKFERIITKDKTEEGSDVLSPESLTTNRDRPGRHVQDRHVERYEQEQDEYTVHTSFLVFAPFRNFDDRPSRRFLSEELSGGSIGIELLGFTSQPHALCN